MAPKRTGVLTLLLAISLAGCRTGSAGTTTVDPEGVIATAHAAAQLTRAAVTPTTPPTVVTPSATTAQTTPTATAAPTPSGPTATATYNANVRSGPGVEYERVDDFYQGQTARLAGRYVNGLGELWWYIERIGAGWNGWVWDGAVVVSGDVSGVPFLEPAPLPTPTS